MGQGLYKWNMGLESENKNNKAQGGPAHAKKEVRKQNNVKKVKRVPLGLEPRSQRLQTRASTTGVAPVISPLFRTQVFMS